MPRDQETDQYECAENDIRARRSFASIHDGLRESHGTMKRTVHLDGPFSCVGHDKPSEAGLLVDVLLFFLDFDDLGTRGLGLGDLLVGHFDFLDLHARAC